MSHSIDFHASQTAMNDQMVEIKPGATWTYTFTADYAGVWMYHCGTAPALEHIANGMFGMVIVEPKGGLPKVDKELAIVQNEWYLGAQGQPADYTKANAAAPAPDFVVFNGVANQYKDNPIAVPTNGRVRVFVLDVGPNIDSSFHIVGTIFDTVTKEGIQLVKGNAGGWGSQAVDLSPAQAAIIEFSPQGRRDVPDGDPRLQLRRQGRRSASSWPATATRRTDAPRPDQARATTPSAPPWPSPAPATGQRLSARRIAEERARSRSRSCRGS